MKSSSYIIILFLLNMVLYSCTGNKKLINKSQTEFGSVRFYAVKTQGEYSNISKVFAEVDSSGIKRYYSFYPDGIMMTDQREKNLSYNVLFQPLPNNFESNIYKRLSRLDTLVFIKAEKLFESANFSHLRRPTGATGFDIEIFYLHGFPKHRRFQPL